MNLCQTSLVLDLTARFRNPFGPRGEDALHHRSSLAENYAGTRPSPSATVDGQCLLPAPEERDPKRYPPSGISNNQE